MDAQHNETADIAVDSTEETLNTVTSEATEPVASTEAEDVSNTHFEEVVREAIEGVGGTLLFKMKVGTDDDAYHAAAAAVGDGDGRNFLLLTLPARGGQLKVETAAKSDDPLAKIAESYAGLMDVLKAAA